MGISKVKQIFNQRNLKIKYPIDSILSFGDKIKIKILDIELFPTTYKIELTTSNGKSIQELTELEIDSLGNHSIKIPKFYSPETIFYYIPPFYEYRIEEVLKNYDSNYYSTFYCKVRNDKISYQMYKENNDYYGGYMISQFKNGIICFGTHAIPNVVLDYIKKQERALIFRGRFKDLIAKNNLDLKTIEEKTLIPLHCLDKLYNGSLCPAKNTLQKLSSFFSVSYDYLAGRSDTIVEKNLYDDEKEDTVYTKIAKNLMYLRVSQNITLYDFAKAVNIPSDIINGYELGSIEPNIKDLILFAQYFECSLDFIVGYKSNMEKFYSKHKTNVALSEKCNELVQIFNSIEPEHQSQILEYARYFKERTKNLNSIQSSACDNL